MPSTDFVVNLHRIMAMRQMKCRCGVPAQWLEMPPKHPHQYRVECPRCHRMFKWGGRAEYDELLKQGSDETVLTMAEQQRDPPDPLAQFRV